MAVSVIRPWERIRSPGKRGSKDPLESSQNPLKVPLLDQAQEEILAWSFAPIIIQDVAASFDQNGRSGLERECPEIDPKKPSIYYYISYAFLKGDPILQINYVAWYSARAGKKPPKIEIGHLDG